MGIAAFDLDKTLLKDNSSYRFARFLYRKKYLSFFSLLFIIFNKLLYELGFLSLSRLHHLAFNVLFRGYSLLVIQRCVTDFLKEEFDLLIYEPVLKKLKQAQDNGDIVVILSSSPTFLVEPIAALFGVTECKATQYAIDKDQKFCHIAYLMLGDDKANFIEVLQRKHNFARSGVVAYSDSIDDLPFLLIAGVAIGVNPDKKLRSYCLSHQWPIID